MVKTNGRSDVENSTLDPEHELPPAEDGNEKAEEASAESSSAESELQRLKAERDALLYRVAEFDNVRRRNIKEQQDFRDYAVADAIKSLLPVLDSFERALQMKSDAAEFRSGVDLIYKQLQSALGKLSLQAIAAEGQLFDPHIHEAIEMVETTGAPDHQVIEELQRGYKLKDRLLRPAMVRVARNPGK